MFQIQLALVRQPSYDSANSPQLSFLFTGYRGNNELGKEVTSP